ncbi:MAG: vWA domain-containing protein [Actinomycetota bacterium]
MGALVPADRNDVYWAGRATLISRHDLIADYDAAFESWFREAGDPAMVALEPVPGLLGEPDDGRTGPGTIEDLQAVVSLASARWRPLDEGDEAEDEEEAAIGIVASDVEVVRTKAFDELTEDEQRTAAALIRRLRLRGPRRSSRRTRPASKGPRFDLRQTLRRSLRTEGEPMRRAWRATRTRRRPIVLILDVSGSMAPYSRALLLFAHAAMASGARVEAFVFGTELSRVTPHLRVRDPEAALERIGRTVRDWEGGTRIGDSLRALLDVWSQRSALRGATVVVCSDGLERGDPVVLARQIERLHRLAHRLIWVNPLKGSPRYEPLARGIAAALPFVDEFVSGHNIQSLESLGDLLTR